MTQLSLVAVRYVIMPLDVSRRAIKFSVVQGTWPFLSASSLKYVNKPNDNAPRSTRPRFGSASASGAGADYHFTGISSDSASRKRSVGMYTPSTYGDDFDVPARAGDWRAKDVVIALEVLVVIRDSSPPPPKLTPKTELTKPLSRHEGVARAIALFDFNAVQVSAVSSIALL